MKQKIIIFYFGVLFYSFSTIFLPVSVAQQAPDSSKPSIRRNPFQPQIPERIEKPVNPVNPERDVAKPTSKIDSDKSARKSFLPPTGKVDAITGQPKIELKPPDLKITGLVWNTSRPQAIINDKVVDVGDTVDEAIIVAINKTGIEVSFDGKTSTITP